MGFKWELTFDRFLHTGVFCIKLRSCFEHHFNIYYRTIIFLRRFFRTKLVFCFKHHFYIYFRTIILEKIFKSNFYLFPALFMLSWSNGTDDDLLSDRLVFRFLVKLIVALIWVHGVCFSTWKRSCNDNL